MFGIGFSELVLIGLILIIFIRPNDLPRVLRIVGKYYGKAKAFYNDLIQVKDQIMKEIDKAATLDEDEPVKTAPPTLPAEKPEEKPAVKSITEKAPAKQEETT